MRRRSSYNSMKNFTFIILTVFLGLSNYSCSSVKADKRNFKENSNMAGIDYVPNEETAKKIAEAVWLPIYGEKIYSQKPYVVSLLDDSVWVVKGTLPKNKRGGVAYIEIQKSDCKILKVTHGK